VTALYPVNCAPFNGNVDNTKSNPSHKCVSYVTINLTRGNQVSVYNLYL